MYEQREDTVTYLRVHSIPGIFDYINFEVRILQKTSKLDSNLEQLQRACQTDVNQHNLLGTTFTTKQ